MGRLHTLPLVSPSDALSGAAPAVFERAARLARSGDDMHRGLVRIVSAVARDALVHCVPPAALTASKRALDSAEAWAQGQIEARRIEKERSDAFAALTALERATHTAFQAALAELTTAAKTPIDEHADRVVLRWVTLGAHYAGSAVVMALDGVGAPGDLASVAQQAAGAWAYFSVGAGAARSSALRLRACEQAEWEVERLGSAHDRQALAVHYFHEYLGANWKDVSDAARSRYFEFIEWALGQKAMN